jgi:hypothetical protein
LIKRIPNIDKQINLGKLLRWTRVISDGGRQVNSRAYLSRFNFGGSDQKNSTLLVIKSVNRLHLAMTLKEVIVFYYLMSLQMI